MADTEDDAVAVKEPCLQRRWRNFRLFLKEPTTYPMFLLSVIALFLNADQNLVAPNLTQIARDFNFTDEERDTFVGGYLNLGFFLVGGIAAMVVGYLTDQVNRRNLFVAVILVGEFSCFCTLFVKDYWGLFVTRAVTGVSIGGSNPLIMSMIGDMFDDRHRGKAIACINIMLSLGVALGQSIAGFIGPADAYGWRAPFVVVATPTFILGPLFYFTTKDPQKGGQEKHVRLAREQMREEQGENYDPSTHVVVYREQMDRAKLKLLLRNKTAVLAFIQGIPGSLPWGVMLVYFQDFLVQDIGPKVAGGITVQESTLVVLTFGAGAGVGIVLGGILADKLWKKDPRRVPLLMAVCTSLGSLPIFGLVNSPPLTLLVYAVLSLPAGVLASVSGSAIRTVLMNVTSPETRGTAFAFHTLFDDIGKGLGPFWVSLLIRGLGGRVNAFNFALSGWIVCALFMTIMCFTVKGDLRKLEQATAAAVERHRQQLGEANLTAALKLDVERTGKVSPAVDDAPESSASVVVIPVAEEADSRLSSESSGPSPPPQTEPSIAMAAYMQERTSLSSAHSDKAEDTAAPQQVEAELDFDDSISNAEPIIATEKDDETRAAAQSDML